MIIQQITSYVNGSLPEQQAMELWAELLANQENMDILEMMYLLKAYYSQTNP